MDKEEQGRIEIWFKLQAVGISFTDFWGPGTSLSPSLDEIHPLNARWPDRLGRDMPRFNAQTNQQSKIREFSGRVILS